MSEAEKRPSEEAIRLQLDRILSNAAFVRSDRLGRFLRYTVEQSLQGRGDQLKESVIGIEVYQRGAEYNPKVDPIVRIEARRLRAKLEEYYEQAGADDRILIDYPKGGYAPVFRFHGPFTVPRTIRKANRWRYPAVVAAALVLALAAGWVGVGRSTLRRTGKTADAEPVSVAVLPFVNLSSDPANDYFSDGLTEELINALAKIDGLRVPARTSVFAFKGKSQDIREIGAKLNVQMVLEGSVRKDGDKLRVTAQLNKVADGYHVWSETYDSEMRDALAIQDRIAQAIAAKLKINANARAVATTVSPEAYNLYLKGRYVRHQRHPEAWRKAVDYFSQAIEKDPNYALAYAGLSNAWFEIGVRDPAQPPEALLKAAEAAKKALEKDDALPEAHLAAGDVLAVQWDWAAAERECKRAIELDPNDAAAHHRYAMNSLALTGRLDRALLEIKRAADLDPIFVGTGQYGLLLFCARRYDEAMEQARKALEMDPMAFGPQNLLGRCYVQKGMLAEAEAEFQKTETISPRQTFWSASLIGLYIKTGHRAEAENLVEQWKRKSQRELRYAEAMTMIYVGLGNKDEAFRWLEVAYREHDVYLPWIKIEPEFDALRSDGRFHVLLHKMNLE